jgi:Alpha-kinase family.
MHCLARYLTQCLVHESPKEFGDSFFYSTCYYSRLKGCAVTVEKFIEGTFQKYTNNNGDFTYKGDNMQLMKKAETFMHYSYIKSNNTIMVTDLQGFGYHLIDPEIASINLRDENNKWMFCPGNCSLIAITNFLGEHECNNYCKLLNL